MAKRTDIKKILIIGSGPIVIGQAAEFDYAGTQACLALKEEGYEVVLCNSNPATIMTDTIIADKVYMEPLTLEYVAKIIRYERPDAIIPGIGGQTGLNLAMQLEKKGILKECRVKLLGTSSASIERAEDREMFKQMCESIGEPVIPSEITYSLEEAKEAAKRIGYPVVLRPAFTLGGTGGGFAYNDDELMARICAFLENGIEYFAPRDYASLSVINSRLEGRIGFDIKSVFIFLIPYYVSRGENISAYATSLDYHLVIRELGEGIVNGLSALFPGESFYTSADHSPIDERLAALTSGLGMLGKNGLITLSIHLVYRQIAEHLFIFLIRLFCHRTNNILRQRSSTHSI